MNSTAISLGWDCGPSSKGIQLNLRTTKERGYKTCPFDIGITNYRGIVDCIKDDFKYFMDSEYLELMNCNMVTSNKSVKIGDKLIRNTKYNFIFNHESPEHGNLWLQESWPYGKNTYVINDFKELKYRYNQRISNFRKYIKNNYVTFIISRYNPDISELKEALKQTYNLEFGLNYTIMHFKPHELGSHATKDFIREHLTLCKVPDHIIDIEIADL
jgi:hypothetical protein